MKKIVTILLISMLALSTTACGTTNDGKNSETSNNSSVAASSTTEKATDNKDTNTDKDDVLSNIKFITYEVPDKNIVIDVPNYQKMDKGYTKIYILHGQRYVAFTAERDSTASNLAEAHEIAFEGFKECIQNYSYVNSLNVENEQTETINGIEVYKYEGTVNCGRDTIYDAYVIGYSFIMDGVPCTITGSIIDQDQDPQMIKEMKATVEYMIQTLRSEK